MIGSDAGLGAISGTEPGCFDPALVGGASHLELADGRRVALHPHRWQQCDDAGDQWLLNHCHGPTIDLGCGPGRLVAGLLDHGVHALGVDVSAQAVARCRGRGAPVVQRDVFADLPAEGDWQHVLLADGNIGIGGDPVSLLRRTLSLVDSTGTVLMEAAPARTGLWRGAARLHDRHNPLGPWFPWALVGPDAITSVARRAGLRVLAAVTHQGRSFARLASG